MTASPSLNWSVEPVTEGARQARPTPLVVDLDHTLIRTDTLHETIVELAFRHPLKLPAIAFSLINGRAAMKRKCADLAQIHCASLPYDAAVLSLIADRRQAGGEVHLVTAADQSIADSVSATLGLFDSATGSNGIDNLKSAAKAKQLAARFGDGFDYVGDCSADIPVWRRSKIAIVAGGRTALAGIMSRAGVETTVLPRRSATLRNWIKALRIHQWSKNFLLFAPLVLSHEYAQPELLLRTILAWCLFGMVASASYLLNDLSDLAADRQHPTKRFRAVAAGLISISTALSLSAALLVGGIVGAWLLHPPFCMILSVYLVVTLAYSLWLKSQPMVDVATIAALFGLRITAGMVIVNHPVSLWLVTFTLVLFLSLALAKRTAELVQAQKSLRVVKGRGYLPGDEPMTMALGIASGIVSVVVMVLYMFMEAMPTGLYANVGPLYLIPAVLGLWLMRIWLRAHRGTLNDDPVIFAIRDPGSWAHAVIVLFLWVAAVGFSL
ncbi:UbiA family prenyltransferase [Sphingobium sp. CECT 9361]|uniref:UbiA family prenyltransferase n=1 Tax=Sphingobium sp. CECT 9361 TaxID=2845384 RepID=UPI001E310B29|nr:UbiA family prenyltransferase [Sphingobium sp. CECT 9361]CAH0351375.1 hypothetical protein SPH9361_01575 [Sphingobium sp. CECT 9361]